MLPSKNPLHPFVKMVIGALSGGVLGIIAGFLLANIILYVNWIFYKQGSAGLPSQSGSYVFLGMSVGAVIGAYLGGKVMSKRDS